MENEAEQRRPKRRPQFGLKRVFITVAIMACGLAWLGFALKWKRDRHFEIKWALEHCSHYSVAVLLERPLPWSLLLVGEDRDEGEIFFDARTSEEIEHIERLSALFPEMNVGVDNHSDRSLFRPPSKVP